MISLMYWRVFYSSIIILLLYSFLVFLRCDPFGDEFQPYCSGINGFSEFYAENIRGHIFAGFLALGGFLMSLKTFIVVSMKENVYDNEKYKKHWKNSKKVNNSASLYGPLKDLSDLLFYAISASIFTAIAQMTVGLYPHISATLFSLFTSVLATLLLIASLRLIKQNLNIWFTYIDQQ